MQVRNSLPIKIGLTILAGFWLAYLVIFLVTAEISIAQAAFDALINSASLGLWSILVVLVMDRFILDWKFSWQVPAHALLAIVFSVLWYFSVTVLLGWRNGDFTGAFSVRPFSSVAFVWQFFQGLTIYLALFAAGLAWRQWLLLQADRSVAQAPLSRLLVRVDEELVPVGVDEIICISGAGDYSEIVTAEQRHLTRRRLSDLGGQLPDQFVRVHRSHLVNLDLMAKAESVGGGRLRIYFSNGVTIDTSRQGARLLRERAG